MEMRLFLILPLFLHAAAELPPGQALLEKSVYEITLDPDQDGLDNLQEYEMARWFSPFVIWDEGEKCALHQTFFQVHPLGENKIGIAYNMTYPLDCGYRSGYIGGHWGDTQIIKILLESPDGRLWRAAGSGLGPWETLEFRGSHIVLYISSGKHHDYTKIEECHAAYRGFDNCGGGPEHAEPIDPRLNVGEKNNPLILSLGAFGQGPYAGGYASEAAWGLSGWGDEKFCGGNPERKLEGLNQCATIMEYFWFK